MSFPDGDDTRLEWQLDNPKKVGSTAWELYERYKNSKTVREAKANGCRTADFNHDRSKGFLVILPKDFAGEAAAEKKTPNPDAKKSEKVDKAKPAVKAEKEIKTEKAKQPDKGKKEEKAEKAEKALKVEKVEKVEKPEKAQKNEKAEKTKQLEKREEAKKDAKKEELKNEASKDEKGSKSLLTPEAKATEKKDKKASRDEKKKSEDASPGKERKHKLHLLATKKRKLAEQSSAAASPSRKRSRPAGSSAEGPPPGSAQRSLKSARPASTGATTAPTSEGAAVAEKASKMARLQEHLDQLGDDSLQRLLLYLHGFTQESAQAGTYTVDLQRLSSAKLAGLVTLIAEERVESQSAEKKHALPARRMEAASPPPLTVPRESLMRLPHTVARPSSSVRPLPPSRPSTGYAARGGPAGDLDPMQAAHFDSGEPLAGHSLHGYSMAPQMTTGGHAPPQHELSSMVGLPAFASGAHSMRHFAPAASGLGESAEIWQSQTCLWAPGVEATLPHQPRKSLGNTEPPGPCDEGCVCSSAASKAADLEKPWIITPERSRLIKMLVDNFEQNPGVFRRGQVSKQNRLQPRPRDPHALQ
eukprot:TRINITY_DN93088_c0_g1_i1.p1 TRINITY_DN93088_c0_g1~~TRINITY_DN93088_c0_g1_i1.p1  ORF type:complete len:586 (+),score=160.41 TRINITY_DN93088_c0_g1_i1:129-1886(+)